MTVLKHTRTLRSVAVTAVLCATATALAATGSGLAAPTAAPKAGPVALLATLDGGSGGKIILAGAIGDLGTSLSIDQNGKPDQNGSYVRVTLAKGTFELDSTALHQQSNSPRPQVASDATCSVSASTSAPVTLLNGTGLYKGIAGTVNATLTFTGVGHRYTTGPKKGQCKHGDNAVKMLATVIGHGNVHFG